ncbi:MAG TPA: hypothetical protein VJ761_05455 [Ktedonobacteraceae bacterium]|nr:hypothetical protein [Ktedonobacteraceae bacterium]
MRVPIFIGSQRVPYLRRIRRRVDRVLRLYWKSFVFLVGAILGTFISPILLQWIQDSAKAGHLTAPDIVHSALVRVFIFIVPWPLTVLGLIVLIFLTWMAWQAHNNSGYQDLLQKCEENYYRVRRSAKDFGRQLGIDRQSMMKVFDTEVYTERSEASRAFDAFLYQQEKRIFLIIGRGGTGKSTFLQHRMGVLTGALPLNSGKMHLHPCVYVDCKSESVSVHHTLMSIVEDQTGYTLREIDSMLSRRGHQPLIIFVDAINENNAQDDITYHLTQFANAYLDGKHPVYLCVSVREAYWDEQRRRYDAASEAVGWLEYVYKPERKTTEEGKASPDAGSVGILMQDFDDDEFENAYSHYARLFAMKGQISDPRMRKICRNPLMLRMLCIALRGQNVTGRLLLRDLDIFDAYADSALEGTIRRVGVVNERPILHGETLPQRAIRGLVLELALGMVNRGRPYLFDEEILEILRREVPDAQAVGRPLQTINDLYAPGSLLQAILIEGEGIVLEADEAKIPQREGTSIIRFVHERYFEYSIGRAIIRRWRQNQMNEAEILRDFEEWMDKHEELVSRGFTNLRQGLGIAVLVAEYQESLDEGLPPRIHQVLLSRLAQNKNFSWNQLACRRITQLRIFNDPSPTFNDERSRRVENLLEVVNVMAGKNDFVLRWDIEGVLLCMVNEHEGQAVLKCLQGWCKPEAPFSKRLFGTESLGYLFKQSSSFTYRVDVVHELSQIIRNSTLDFWIRRSLTFSISTMLDALDEITTADPLIPTIRRDILFLATELQAGSQSQWERSVSISAQVARDSLNKELNQWLKWNWRDEEVWTCTNVVLALEKCCSQGYCTAVTIKLLQLLWDSRPYSPHLSYALIKVLDQAINYPRTSDELRLNLQALKEVAVEYTRAHQHVDERSAWILPEVSLKKTIDTPVAIVYHPAYAHTDLLNHPESKERVEAIIDFLDHLKIPAGRQGQQYFRYVSPYSFYDNDRWDRDIFRILRTVHEEEWIRRVRDLSEQLKKAGESNIVLESDLEVREGSYEEACFAVRGALCAVDLVVSNPDVRLAVALLRPPGHLAGNKICIFNNIAIAARYAQERGKRGILIVDCDAHHGQSTHSVFYNDGTVVYFSTHQAGVHPGTGKFEERGAGAGLGYIVNVPIPATSGDRVYEEVLNRILRPLLDGFKPDLILISMGLDAYYKDDFSQLEFSEYSFLALAHCLNNYCQQHKNVGVVAALEGGYSLEGMGPCAFQFMKVFGGWPVLPDEIKLERKGKSSLDTYLRSYNEGKADVKPADEDQVWLQDLRILESSIKQQRWLR